MTEKEIQKYIWKKKDKFYKLLSKPSLPKRISRDSPWEYSPSEYLYNLILEDYLRTWEMMKDLSLEGKLPVFYYDNTAMTAIYTASTALIRRLLPRNRPRHLLHLRRLSRLLRRLLLRWPLPNPSNSGRWSPSSIPRCGNRTVLSPRPTCHH